MSGRGRGRARANPNNNIIENNNNNDLAAAVQQLVVMNQSLIQVVTQLTQARNPNVASVMTKSVSLQRPCYFDGKWDPVKLEAWVRSFDKIFATLNCPEDLKIAQATHYLTENADIWWTENNDRLMAPRPHVDEGVEVMRVMNWEEFKTSLRTEFFPEHLKRGKRTKFNNLKQGTLSVQEYYNQFQELARFALELVPTPESRASRFEQGLDINIRAALGGWDYSTILDVYTKSSNVERIFNERNTVVGDKRKNYSGMSEPTQELYRDHHGFYCDGNPWKCAYCGRTGHRTSECRTKLREQGNHYQSNNFRQTQSAGAGSSITRPQTRGYQGGNRYNNNSVQNANAKPTTSTVTTGAKSTGQVNVMTTVQRSQNKGEKAGNLFNFIFNVFLYF
ncbi:hypothetical protein RND81_11G077700 [Saponaria officinalis]|uniref:CCHC-type domain-containing protein n=1 Tax=Saponaria officinalis TaxID=3572 RepID=A0AAW1HJ96_SAPOF